MIEPVNPAPRTAPSLINPALTRIVMWILVLAAAFWTLEHIKMTLTIFGMAFLIAYLLNSVVSTLESRYQMARGKAIILVYVLLFLFLGVSAAIAVPLIIQQVNGMVAKVPEIPVKFNYLADHIRNDYFSQVPAEYQEQIKTHIAESASSAAEAAKSLFVHLRNFILGLVSAAFLIFTSFIVSVYVLLRWNSLGQGLLDVLPAHYRQEIRNLGMDLHRIFGGYLKAQITLATACGISTLVILFLHSLVTKSNPYMLVIACVAALTFPIPVINQVIPPVVGGILGYINSDPGSGGGYALTIAVLVYTVNVVIERTIAPGLMSEAVGVSPLFVLFAAFSGAELLGPVGALLGVPLAAMVKSIFVWFHGRFLSEEENQAYLETVAKAPEPLAATSSPPTPAPEASEPPSPQA